MCIKTPFRIAKNCHSFVLVLLALSSYVNAQNVRAHSESSLHEHDKPEPVIMASQVEVPHLQTLIEQIAQSGRILEIAVPPADRLQAHPQIAPGAAPVLRFRVLEQQTRFRLGRLDLVVDDAGH
jgi:hypothetical protein